MDDVASYRTDVRLAVIQITEADMGRTMNRHLLPAARTVIRDVRMRFGQGEIRIDLSTSAAVSIAHTLLRRDQIRL